MNTTDGDGADRPRQHAPRPRRLWLLAGIAVVVVVGSVVLALAVTGWTAPSSLGRVDRSVASTPAPSVSLRDLDGGTVTLADFRGQVVVVNFWASWCVPCREEVGELKALARAWNDRGVRLLGVVENDTAAAARRFTQRYGVSWPSVLDEDRRVALDFGVRGVPETYVVGPDGRLVAKVLGRIRADLLDEVLSTASRRTRQGGD